MKKLLFLFLALPFFVASCSSDDKDDVEPEIGTFKIEVKTISYNKISLDWNKVSEAYSYQVFYKAEGASKWETSNSIMPIDNGMTVHWNGDFASFAPDTKYSVQVKAFRDSREGSVMAESNILEIKTLTDIGFFNVKGKAISHNKINLDWDKVPMAYSYQVFYKAEGDSKWETSNFITPIDNGMTVHWNGDFVSFAPDTKYSVQVKAFRDSREGSLIAESNVLEIKTLTEDGSFMVGKWKQIYLRAVAETSDAELTTFIEKEYLKDYKGTTQYEFFDNKTFVYEHTENPDVWVDKYRGQYYIQNDIIAFLYADKNGVKVEDVEMVKFAIGESDFYIVRDLDEKEYENILNIFNSSTPVEQLVINRVTFEYVYTRVQ